MEQDLDQDGTLFDARSAPFFWLGNEFVDAGHLSIMGPKCAAVYFVLLRYRNLKSGKTWPSAARIAKLTGICKRKVVEYRRELVDLGYIESADQAKGREYTIVDKFRSSASSDVVLSPDLAEGSKEKKKPQRDLKPSAGFDAFWAEWPKHPRKTNRVACLAAWNARGLEPIADQIVAAVRAFKASRDWLKEDGRYVPLPLSWLNQRSWEAAEYQKAAAGGTPADKPGFDRNGLGDLRAPTADERRMLFEDDADEQGGQ